MHVSCDAKTNSSAVMKSNIFSNYHRFGLFVSVPQWTFHWQGMTNTLLKVPLERELTQLVTFL